MNEPTQIAFPIPEEPKPTTGQPQSQPSALPIQNTSSSGFAMPEGFVSAPKATPAVAQTVTAPVAEFKPYSVNAKDETVESRIAGLLDTNSINMQRAKARGQLDAGRRGLLNSTIAGQAGQAALIDQALPIASSDAGWYRQVASDNFKTGNEFSLANAGNALSAATTTAQLGTNVSLANMQETGTANRFDTNWANDIAKGRITHGYDLETQAKQAESQKEIAGMQIASNASLEASRQAAAASLEEARIAADNARNQATIQANKDLRTMDATTSKEAAATLAKVNAEANAVANQNAIDAAKAAATARTEEDRIKAENNLKSTVQASLATLVTDTNNSIVNIMGNEKLDDATKDEMINRLVTAAKGTQASYKSQLVAINYTPPGDYFNFDTLNVSANTGGGTKSKREEKATTGTGPWRPPGYKESTGE